MNITREEHGSKGKFILYKDEQQIGMMTYSKAGNDKIIIDHTEVNEGQEGNGYGEKLVMEAVSFARKNDLKINPLCPFAKHVFDKDNSLNDVRF